LRIFPKQPCAEAERFGDGSGRLRGHGREA
jgi:hypothetical protein